MRAQDHSATSDRTGPTGTCAFWSCTPPIRVGPVRSSPCCARPPPRSPKPPPTTVTTSTLTFSLTCSLTTNHAISWGSTTDRHRDWATGNHPGYTLVKSLHDKTE